MMTPDEHRTRPTTFGIPQPIVSHHWDWEQAILDAVSPADLWMAYKFSQKLREHKGRHPAFKVERVAEMFIDAPTKFRAYYCYQPISKFTKSIHKAASLRSQAMGQS
jgi:hypothetical protein